MMSQADAIAEVKQNAGNPALAFMGRALEEIFECVMECGFWPRKGRVRLDVGDYLDTLTASDASELLCNLWTGGEATQWIKRCHEPTLRHWIEFDCASHVLDLAADMAREEENGE